MTASLVVGVVVLVLLGLGGWLSWTASRLDRLHRRIDIARVTLEAQLQRRSGAALELASSEGLDPASRLLLVDAAHRSRNAGPDEQESAESRLSQALRAVLDDPDQVQGWRRDELLGPLVEELAERCAKVELARRFLGDAVATARPLRSRRRVRWLRLAGHAPALRTVDLDDRPPAGLTWSTRS